MDEANEFPENMSGLKLVVGTPDVMWAVNNDPPMLYKLEFNGTFWMNALDNGWSHGKTLLFPDGTAKPDTEDITLDDQV